MIKNVLLNLLDVGFSSPIKVPTIDVLTNDTPLAIGTAKEMSKKHNVYDLSL